MAKRNLELWILLVVFLGALNSAASFTLTRQQHQFKQNDGPVSHNTSNFQEPQSGCTSDRLAMYKIVLHTYWTRELFPKHYPDWRPPAQWTKTIGRSHDSSYVLFRLGQLATPGVRLFAETGKTDSIDNQASVSTGTSSTTSRQSVGGQRFDNGIFDEFTFSAIPVGEGRSEGRFFADGNHSLVSLMTRIVPSPDWFIGLDSFQLCVGGTWIDTVTVEMDPLDAGTDNGFTFTAPNWPTDPQGVIYRMTSRYPAHQASSFYYPKSKRLPPIATFQFIKMKEYELSDVFNFGEDDRKYETVETRTHLESEHNHVEMNNELSASIERERQNEVTVVPVSYSEKDKVRARMLAKMNPQKNTTETLDSIDVLPKNNKKAIFNNISQHYETRKQRKRVSRQPRDCRVSHWSEWSPCSKTCGIGDMHRYRKVIKYAKRGGRPCPPLQESKWCGSSRDCKPATYFNWNPTS